MSKYQPLTDYLVSTEANECVMSFEAIEKILGFELPPSAYTHRPWWANSASGHSQSQSWQSVGWQTSNVDLDTQSVTFYYVLRNIKPILSNKFEPITIEEAKQGLAANFGVEPDCIEITIRA